jgi:peroxiredoxin
LQAFNTHFAEFDQAGAEILAVTGEKPEHFGKVAPGLQQLYFPVLFDDGFSVMRQYGIVYELTPELAKFYKDKGLDLTVANGTDKPTLPMPAVYVVQPDGRIKAAWVEVDHTVRPEIDEVLDAVKEIDEGEESGSIK